MRNLRIPLLLVLAAALGPAGGARARDEAEPEWRSSHTGRLVKLAEEYGKKTTAAEATILEPWNCSSPSVGLCPVT